MRQTCRPPPASSCQAPDETAPEYLAGKSGCRRAPRSCGESKGEYARNRAKLSGWGTLLHFLWKQTLQLQNTPKLLLSILSFVRHVFIWYNPPRNEEISHYFCAGYAAAPGLLECRECVLPARKGGLHRALL